MQFALKSQEIPQSQFDRVLNGNRKNGLQELDAPIHRWWRFILAFPPHLVSQYLDEFGCEGPGSTVLDPFSGTGTTLVEAKRRGCFAIGLEALDFCFLASKVKTTWEISLPQLERESKRLFADIAEEFSQYGFFSENSLFQDYQNYQNPIVCPYKLSLDQQKLLGKGYISDRPLQKLLTIQKYVLSLPPSPVADFFKMALGSMAVIASNVGFGPEIYCKKMKKDEDVWALFSNQIKEMLADLQMIQKKRFGPSSVFHQDARTMKSLGNLKIDAVITSPPYPNEKNYGRITRIENIITNLIQNKEDLRRLKKGLIRSNSQNMYKGDDDHRYVEKFSSIQRIANEIEERRLSLGKTSGWEKLYPLVAKNYFGGLYRHLLDLKPLLKRGGRCAYVVGDQMSFLMVHIKTGEILAELASDIGYKIVKIDLWRERWASASKTPIREEVVVFSKK
ncbi:MAG: DNA modification methyltransferase [Nitrospirales bacterium]|nr:MAG: DNA modification methyltransferase [Nitrospirales bacterium]